MKPTKTTVITLVIKHTKKDPDLLDKVAGRAYTLDGVEDVEVKLIAEVKQDDRK